MKINCIIVEDEPLALERMREYVHRLPLLRLCKIFDNAIEAIAFLKSEPIDLIFLDVQMDGFTGIQLLESLSHRPNVILTTAFDSYAVKGFELNVADYLLKPFSFERFVQAVERVCERKSLNEKHSETHIFVKVESRIERIELTKILFIEGMRDYRKIHTVNKRLMTLENFKDLGKRLPSDRFCRVHKSYLVSTLHIDSIERGRIKINDHYIPISETYREEFFKLIDQ